MRGDGDIVTISEVAEQGFSGNKWHKYAEIVGSRYVTIDESTASENNVDTSVDCYVAGTYIGRDGATIEVRQRYTIYVSYSRSTQRIAMTKVRATIINDFERNFPSFHITDVFLPEEKFITPLGKEGLRESEEFYYGSELFKTLSRRDVGRFRVGTERDIFKSRISQIKRRFNLR